MIELRREGLSTYEISARLADEGIPLNRTSVGEILAEEGFGRLLRPPAEQASTAVVTPGRDSRLPRTAPLDFASWSARCDSAKAGLLLLVPDLVALDLPALVNEAGYPSTRVVPAASWLLSLLALKLTRPGGSPTAMTCCSPTRPRHCWPGWPRCPRRARSPTTPTGPATSTSAPSSPPWTVR